jgi:hypothetical protein
MIETEPIKVLMCVDCGWTRPYAPVPREGAPMGLGDQKPPQKPASAQDEALDAAPDYYDAGVMDNGGDK